MRKIVALAQDPNIDIATAIYSGVTDYIEDHHLDWQLIVLGHAFESQLIKLVESHHIEGAIGSFVSDRWVSRLTDRGLSAVNLFQLSSITAIPSVGLDEKGVGRVAARHLIEQGASSMSYLGRGRSEQGRLRISGMHQEAGNALIFETDPFAPIAEVIANASGRSKPIGFFCSSDRVAREFILQAESEGLRIGKDLLVIGVGDEQAESLFAGIQISSFCIPAQSLGYQAAEILAGQLKGSATVSETLSLKAQFIPRASSLSTRSARLASHALQIGAARLGDPQLDVNTLARRAGCSRRTLELSMEKELGESPFQMLSRLRLQKAKHLLASTQIPIGEIGQQCGYPEAHHFSAWFKNRTGLSPRNYQKTLRR